MVAADLPWTIQLEDVQVWQRERTTLSVSVETTDRFATLEASLPRIEGVDVQALPATNETGTDGKRVLRLTWQLSAHTPGKQTIQLPAIRYNLNGRDAAQWQPPTQTLEVQALPPYLPPTIPVGKVEIESRIEPNGWLQPEHLAYWHISLHSDTVHSAQFPAILKQLHSSGVELFPAKVEKAVGDTQQYRLDYHIPFKAQHSGKLDLPTLQWHWFDPATARLEQVQYTPPSPLVLGWMARIALILLGSLLLLGAVLSVGKRAKQRWQQWRSKQRVWQAVQGGNAPQTVKQAMCDCALVHAWPDNFSTGQWLACWEQRYGQTAALRTQLEAVEHQRFTATPCSQNAALPPSQSV